MHHTSTVETSHTHWSSHISGKEQLALQQTQTNTHTTVLLSPLTHTPSLQFTPLLPTTTPTPAPLGRPYMGEMAVMVSWTSRPTRTSRDTWCRWNTRCGGNRLTLCSATHYRHAHYHDSTHHPTHSNCHYCWWRSDLHPLGEDLLPNRGWD